ncbi:nucleoprotein TPR [Drosophila subpulchrella]|uniref:nucleoprotein TPR n=1 Tax=Drosophila subpulchrella TaxID=1486046 RepID=UPI0018A1A855|nr:nucleoprotein TPR [Drosophila subpulchrella]
MVNRYKGSRSVAASDGVSASSKDSDQVYCVLLHVVEAINFVGRDATEREQIVMNAALNTVDFEVEGTQSTEKIIFNSNCIWECDMAGIKRIKTDHRPVKLTFYACRGGGPDRKTVGSLLLPIRGLPVLSTSGSQNSPHLKMLWHKLICISSEFRSQKPEVLLMLAIIKKSILHTKDFDHLMQFTEVKSPPTPPMQSPGHSITASMLQSQANVYVQSLVQLGLLQVGNDPLVDCDIIEVVLQLKQLKNVSRLVKSVNQGRDPGSVILVFDFVGNVTNIELKLNESDSYILNDVLGLRFKTSLRSMRLYFQRIFYLPINMYMNGTAIANYRMDFTNLLPPDNYFSDKQKYTYNGSFSFNRFGRTDSGREPKPPLMEYTFSVDVKTIFSRQGQEEPEPTPSVASGVIREPKDRKNTAETSLSLKTASVDSLNVGAELSASEGSYKSSPPEDMHDSDGPADLPKTQIRRKKSTRFNSKDANLESEDEQYLGQRFSASVVREGLNLNENEEATVLKSKENEHLSDESNAESTSIKFSKVVEEEINDQRRPTMKSTAEESPLPSKPKITSHGSKGSIRESSQFKMKPPTNPSPIVEEMDSENFEELSSLDLFELEEKRQAKEAELESLRRQMKKAGQAESLQMSMDRKIKKTKKVDIEVEGSESNLNITDEVIPKPLSKLFSKDKVNKTKLKTEPKPELHKVPLTQENLSKLRNHNILEDSFERSEENLSYGYDLPEKPNSARDKLRKNSKAPRTVKAIDCMDTDLETDISVLNVRSKGKTKSQLMPPEELEDFEETSTSTQGTRRPKTSRGDLNLRARWVEVNKAQTHALGETEKFLQETCRAELDEVLYEDQLALGLAKPPKAKKKLGKAKVKSIDCESSYVEEITYSERDLVDNPNHQVELEGSEDYISLSEGNSISAENISSETEHRDLRVTFAQSKVMKKKLRVSSGKDHLEQMDFRTSEEYISMSESNIRTAAKRDRVGTRMRALVEEDQENQVDFRTSIECIPQSEGRRTDRVNKKKKTTLDVASTSSQEFISMSESNVNTAEMMNPYIEQRDVRIIEKNKRKKTLIHEDPVNDYETLEEESVKPVKKKIIRKKSSVILDNEDHVVHDYETLEEESVKPVKKKVIKKKSSVILEDKDPMLYDYETLEEESVKPVKKKIIRKKSSVILEDKDPVLYDYETLEEESVKPVKKKIIRKKSSVISESIEQTAINNPTLEVVHTQPKKIVRKKAKTACDIQFVEECPRTKKVLSSRKELKNLTTSEDDFSVQQPLKAIDAIGQRVKSWRRQQIYIFEQELARKELHYKKQLEEMEHQETRVHQLNKEEANLDVTFISNRTNVPSVDYEAKFKELEEHIALLKTEMEAQVRLFENRSGELRQENLQLYTERTELKVRIAAMEQQIGDLKAQGSDDGDLKEVLGELRTQSFRYNKLASEKELYRKRWRRSLKRVHALKLAMYERNLERVHSSIKIEPIDLRKVLTKDAMEFEREYGQFRKHCVSSKYPFSSLSGSGDFSPPNKKPVPTNEF